MRISEGMAMCPFPAEAAAYIGPTFTPAATVLWDVLVAPLVEFAWAVLLAMSLPQPDLSGVRDFAPLFAKVLLAALGCAGIAVAIFIGLVILTAILRNRSHGGGHLDS